MVTADFEGVGSMRYLARLWREGGMFFMDIVLRMESVELWAKTMA